MVKKYVIGARRLVILAVTVANFILQTGGFYAYTDTV
jgi:hypothetical protein